MFIFYIYSVLHVLSCVYILIMNWLHCHTLHLTLRESDMQKKRQLTYRRGVA